MTTVDRFRSVFAFEKPDRLPVTEWAGWWNKTLDRWYGEGLPKELRDQADIDAYVGLDSLVRLWPPTMRPDCPQAPSHGAPIILDEAGYEALRPRLYPELTPDHWIVQRLQRLVPAHESGKTAVWISYDGFFWFHRKLLGIENHLYSFYDQPALYHRISDDLEEYTLRCLETLFDILKPDFYCMSEDMSYNLGPMIGEDLFDEFMLPHYRKINDYAHSRGVPVLIDSDGDVTKMIPWFQRGGIDGVLPLERQAGVDIHALQKAYPKFLFLGGYDKMVMPRGEEAMRREFERLLPAVRHGGFIPGVDHQTPPGVSFENYKTYLRLFKEYAEKV